MGNTRQLTRFSLEKTVGAKREIAYEILSDYENYEILVPQHFPSVRVRSVRGNVSVVEEHMNLGGNELLIMAKHVTTKPVMHEVFVIGGDAKGSYIRQQFVEISGGTKIIVDADLKLKCRIKISGMFRGDRIKKDYARILDDFVEILKI